ncbi:outer membrane beta-barrel protein [Hymenobacter lutimineralis]|uniref:Outer membrane beta-barrel protein n=1 Tax=Hymenobacter lutimineralis TaxID=2606448 RepID=A0A5D6VDB3_9BACT|nr:outer membrane beta-barrel protein [Hymenobacter lutimineralis]TYZ13360.1 outer membrane beta-barrel protein [Hymenobacter lutimineralis]
MEPSADKPQNTQTGNLEQLFRQKFEEAEIAPRASLWEQIDHDLLVQQNETYRQRLQLHRWAAAACLLFALAMGAWFTIHLTGTHEADVAAATAGASGSSPRLTSKATSEAPAVAPAAVSPGADVATSIAQPTRGGQKAARAATVSKPALNAAFTAPTPVSGAATVASKGEASNRNQAFRGAIAEPVGSPVPVGLGASTLPVAATTPERETTLATGRALTGDQISTTQSAQLPTATLASAVVASQGQTVASAEIGATAAGQVEVTKAMQAVAPGSQQATAAAEQFATIVALAPRETTLSTTQAALPASLQPMYLANSLAWADALAQEDEKKQVATRGWMFGGGHAVSAFNPNMNFSRGSLPTGTVRIASTAMVNAQMYEAGAREYRENLQAGLGQRIMLLARRRISNRFSISAGAEAAEYRASSQTSYAALEPSVPTTFTGGFASTDRVRTQMATDLTVLNEPQKTRYRYRSAGIPVLVQYGNNVKNGWSFYARMGAAVNVLFGTRFSADDNMLVAQKAYSLQSGDSPYRKVLTSLRSGAGLNYRPAGASWAVAFGPAAEAGLNTLNVDPAQSYWQQSRPYSLGLEASVEFGSKSAPVLAAH